MSDEDFVKDFNLNVLEKIKSFGFKTGNALCLGVSGGADSVCLLTSIVSALAEQNKKQNLIQKINVVTVNHRIRKEEESLGDCEYVKNYCKTLSTKNVKVECRIINLKENEVSDLAEKRKRGTEDAARCLRYEVFKKFAEDIAEKEKTRKVFFALAHNQNDQLETLVMRFLQGAGNLSRAGIAEKRVDKNIIYIRPLIETSRADIERYLKISGIKWRTDSTNECNDYLRNRIRNLIVPVFDEAYPGWKSALINGRQKALYENDFIEKSIKGIKWNKCTDGVWIKTDVFYLLDVCLRQNLLYRAFDIVNTGERIPFSFVKKVIDRIPPQKINKNSIEVYASEDRLFVKKIEKKATESGFFAIIEEPGFVEFDDGTLYVRNDKGCRGKAEIQFVTRSQEVYSINRISYPFCFRSRMISDRVAAKNGEKALSDVFSDFKVAVSDREKIPVIEELGKENKIRAVWGSILGYKNWIVLD